MLIHEFLINWVPNDGKFRTFCEILLRRCPESNAFLARHTADRNHPKAEELTRLRTVEEVVSWSEFSISGEDRPLKTAPSLKSGWIISETSAKSFGDKIDAFYPGALEDTANYYHKDASPVDFRSFLKSQDCKNLAEKVTDAQINRIMRETCFRGCLRRISWGIDDSCAVSKLPPPNSTIPAICNQACEVALAAIKRISA